MANKRLDKGSKAPMQAASLNLYLTRGATRLLLPRFVMRHKSGARHPSSLIILLHRVSVSAFAGAIFLTNYVERNMIITAQLGALRIQTSALGVGHRSIWRAQAGGENVRNDR